MMEMELDGVLVTDDPALLERFSGYTDKLEMKLNTLIERILSGSERSLHELEKFAAKNRGNPHIRFTLAESYLYLDDNQRYMAEVTSVMNDFPGYIFGRAAMAENLAHEWDRDSLLELLGGSDNIGEANPGRDRFHVREFKSFYRALFYVELNQTGVLEAGRILGMLRKVATNPAELKMMEEDLKDYEADPDMQMMNPGQPDLSMPEDMARLLEEILEGIEEEDEEDEDYDEWLDEGDDSLEYDGETEGGEGDDGTVAKMPGSDDIDRLATHIYEYPIRNEVLNDWRWQDLGKGKEFVKVCRSLPGESLVSDLQIIIDRALVNHGYFAVMPEAGGMRDLVWHALLMLTEMRATEAFPALRRILVSPPEVIDFWFMPAWTAVGIDIIYALGRNNLPELLDIYTDVQLEPAEQITLLTAMGVVWREEPGRKQEVADWFEMVIRYNAMRLADGRELSPPMLTVLARETASLGIKELREQAESLIAEFNLKFPGTEIPGDELGKVLRVPVRYRLKTLDQLYNELLSC
jgi:hypothetical protein